MKRRLGILVLIIALILIVGCKKETSADTAPQTADNTTTADTAPAVEEKPAAETPVTKDLASDYEALKASGLSASAITQFLKDNKKDMNSVLGTEVMTDYITYMRQALDSQTEIFYSDSYIDIHQAIDKAIEEHSADFENNMLVGAGKVKILEYMDNPDFKKVLEQCFEDGLGLMNGEGTYYPVIDYYAMNAEYGQFANEELKAFLDLAGTETQKPLTVEEYLAVTPQELGDRALAYERFLVKYPDALYRDEVRNNLMVAIWKLVNPNPFDGMLNEDFTLSPELDMVYQQLLKADDAPVVQTSVRGILEFAASMNGVLGTLDNEDALMEESYKLHDAASKQITELYKIEGF